MNIIKMMTPVVNIALLRDKDSVRYGCELMFRRRYTAVPVIGEDGTYKGSVTEGDILRCVMKNGSTAPEALDKVRIGDIMRRDFCPALDIGATREDVLTAIFRQNYIPIVDSRRALCGIITRRSVMEYLTGE